MSHIISLFSGTSSRESPYSIHCLAYRVFYPNSSRTRLEIHDRRPMHVTRRRTVGCALSSLLYCGVVQSSDVELDVESRATDTCKTLSEDGCLHPDLCLFSTLFTTKDYGLMYPVLTATACLQSLTVRASAFRNATMLYTWPIRFATSRLVPLSSNSLRILCCSLQLPLISSA